MRGEGIITFLAESLLNGRETFSTKKLKILLKGRVKREKAAKIRDPSPLI